MTVERAGIYTQQRMALSGPMPTIQVPVTEDLRPNAFVSMHLVRGRTQAPPNPIQSTLATFTPNPAKDLFMNSGDVVKLSVSDTGAGVRVVLDDRTTHQSGSMTASAANGFAQIKFDPTGTSCTPIPYDFHPMYSTSSEKTNVPWAAHTYNIAFSDEIGQLCDVARVELRQLHVEDMLGELGQLRLFEDVAQ